MASPITLPSFSAREKLLYTKLNALVAAINAKFAAGVSASDLAWPLTAEGNLDMSIYNIVGGRQIWGAVNAAEYDTLADAISAAGTGGVVVVPPETTIVASGATHTGSGATIIGSGPSSVLQLSTGATAGSLLASTSGTGLRFLNLKFDGNSATGTSQIGLDLQGCSDVLVSGCEFVNFSGAAVKVSNGCGSVIIENCYFSGGTEEHIYVTECADLMLSNVYSASAGGIGIRIACSGATAYTRLKMMNVEVTGSASTGISLLGYNAVGSASPFEVTAANVIVKSNVANVAVQVGSSTASAQSVQWVGGRIYGSAAGGLLVNASAGTLTGVTVEDPATFCVDLDISQYMTVTGCVLTDGTIGIDGGATGAECVLSANVIKNCTTNIVRGGTGLVAYGNGAGQLEVLPYTGYCSTLVSQGTASGTDPQTIATIPANTLSMGSFFAISLYVAEGQYTLGGSGTCLLRIDGNNVFYDTYDSTAIGTTQHTYYLSGHVYSATAIRVMVQGNLTTSVRYYQVTGLDFTAAIDVELVADGDTGGVNVTAYPGPFMIGKGVYP